MILNHHCIQLVQVVFAETTPVKEHFDPPALATLVDPFLSWNLEKWEQ